MPNHASGKKNYRLRVILSTLFLLVVLFAGATFYFYSKSNAPGSQQAKQSGIQEEKIIQEVASLMILPEGEAPTVATVSDPGELLGHPFFIHAKKGDKVIIYRTSGRIVLYRPEEGKIVEAGILDAGEPFPVK